MLVCGWCTREEIVITLVGQYVSHQTLPGGKQKANQILLSTEKCCKVINMRVINTPGQNLLMLSIRNPDIFLMRNTIHNCPLNVAILSPEMILWSHIHHHWNLYRKMKRSPHIWNQQSFPMTCAECQAKQNWWPRILINDSLKYLYIFSCDAGRFSKYKCNWR